MTEQGYIIPFPEVRRLCNFYPYGHPWRVCFELIALTGCRLKEVTQMDPQLIHDGVIYWHCGKNQRGTRSVNLPLWFLKELDYHLEHNSHPSSRIFPFKSNWISHVLNKFVRRRLGGDWLRRRPNGGLTKYEYVYMLKNLRHNWASLDFNRFFWKYGPEMALSATSRHMRHDSGQRLTAAYYLDGLESLELEKYRGKTMGEVLNFSEQRILPEFFGGAKDAGEITIPELHTGRGQGSQH